MLKTCFETASCCRYAFHLNAAAAWCTRRFQWRTALRLLGRKLPRRNLSATVNALKQGARWDSALALFESFATRSLEADASGCNALASALEKSTWRQVFSFVHGLPELDDMDMTHHSQLRVSPWSLALAVQVADRDDGVQADQIGLNAVIAPMAKAGQWLRVFEMFPLFGLLGVKCDGASYATAMDACRDSWSSAAELLLRMQLHGLTPCRFQYTAVCDVCAAAQNWERALHVFDMSKTSDTWDILLGTSGLAAVSKSNKWASAMYTFAALPEVRLQPNTITSTSALSACERGGQWEMSLLTLNCMIEKRLVNQVSFSTTMQACEKYGEWQLLSSLLAKMIAPRLQRGTYWALCILPAIF